VRAECIVGYLRRPGSRCRRRIVAGLTQLPPCCSSACTPETSPCSRLASSKQRKWYIVISCLKMAEGEETGGEEWRGIESKFYPSISFLLPVRHPLFPLPLLRNAQSIMLKLHLFHLLWISCGFATCCTTNTQQIESMESEHYRYSHVHCSLKQNIDGWKPAKCCKYSPTGPTDRHTDRHTK